MLLFDYLKKIRLPNPIIRSQGRVSRFLSKKDILTLWDAIKHISQLPYGRTVNRENYLQIVDDNKGTCSTKHAFIAALAEELFIPLKLTLGIFLLTPKNRPEIVPILKHYRLEAIPEAHCYLKFNNDTLDITFPNSLEFSFDADLEQEINMTSRQIGLFKIEKHKEFINSWIKDKSDLNSDLIWTAREEWIRKLSEI